MGGGNLGKYFFLFYENIFKNFYINKIFGAEFYRLFYGLLAIFYGLFYGLFAGIFGDFISQKYQKCRREGYTKMMVSQIRTFSIFSNKNNKKNIPCWYPGMQ